MEGKRKPNLLEVADLSGFSLASVSMILNGGYGASFAPGTVAKVLAAAESLGYRPRKKREVPGGTIAVLCPNISNPYYATLVQALEAAAGQAGFKVMVLNSYRSPEAEAANLAAAVAAKVAGLVFAMRPLVGDPLPFLGRGVPAVAIGDRGCAPTIDAVEMDNYGAGLLVGRHLAGLGHRRITYLSTTLDDANNMRLRRLKGLEDGFLSACPGGSVSVRARKVTPAEELADLLIEHEVGLALAGEGLAAGETSAFVCINDMVAYGAIDAVLARGLSVPGDYSVCGFDDIFPSRLRPISLTTVDNYIVEKGRSAFSMLLARMRKGPGGEGPEVLSRVEYRPRLVVRASTAAPREP